MSAPVYPSDYPIEDWPALVVSLSPTIAVMPPGDSYLASSFGMVGLLDDGVAALYGGLNNLGDATSGVLDVCGDLVSEVRGGLTDSDYRRVIAGRRVASEGGGAVTSPRVYQGWVVVAAPVIEARITQEPDGLVIPYAGVTLSALVNWTPTSLWLARAGVVVSDLMGAGYDVTATVATPATCLYGQTYGRPYSYSLQTGNRP